MCILGIMISEVIFLPNIMKCSALNPLSNEHVFSIGAFQWKYAVYSLLLILSCHVEWFIQLSNANKTCKWVQFSQGWLWMQMNKMLKYQKNQKLILYVRIIIYIFSSIFVCNFCETDFVMLFLWVFDKPDFKMTYKEKKSQFRNIIITKILNFCI